MSSFSKDEQKLGIGGVGQGEGKIRRDRNGDSLNKYEGKKLNAVWEMTDILNFLKYEV